MVMILILIGIIVAAIISGGLFYFGAKYDRERYTTGKTTVLFLVGVFMSIATCFTLIAYCFTVWSWVASDYKKNIINREYNTEYSQAEVFFAEDVIDTIRELDRQRIEVNGNLMRGK